jgi:hypothetical protein
MAGIATAPVVAAPHSPQNFCPSGSGAPHAAQMSARRAPHSPQNFWLVGFAAPQLLHVTIGAALP